MTGNNTMKLIEVENIKEFTSRLFVGEFFDNFLAVETTIYTATAFIIDGHINKEFVGEEGMQLPEYAEGIVMWKKIKPICYDIIKGKRVPQKFKMIFKMPSYIVDAFLKRTQLNIDLENVAGLYLNVNYQDGKMSCTTGASLKTFSLDKSLEQQWDEYMAAVIRKIS